MSKEPSGRDISLPVVDPAEDALTIRRSKSGPRRAIVLALVQLAMIGHVVLWLVYGTTVTPVEPSESMETVKHGVINAGAVFFALALLSTLIFGRYFCGWGCHIVMLQDLCGWMMKKCGIHPRPFRSRLLLYVPLLLALYMFVWPLFYRFAIAPFTQPEVSWPGFSTDFTTSAFWDTFAPWPVAIPFLFVCGFGVVYFLGAKGFCTYGCPYGGFFAPIDKYAPGRIRVTDDCEQCGHCTAVCTSNVRVHDEVREYGMVIDPGCMKCMDCVSVCPNDALYFGFGKPAVMKGKPKNKPPRRILDLSWPEEIGLAVMFGITFFSTRGAYGLIPMLFAVGIAACVTWLVWRCWRMMGDDSVNLHRFRLKYKGVMRSSGWVVAGFTGLFMVLIAHTAVVQVISARGYAAYTSIDPGAPPEAESEKYERAIALLTLTAPFYRGGIGLANSPQNGIRLSHLYDRRGEFELALAALRRALDRRVISSAAHDYYLTLIHAGRTDDADGFARQTLAEHAHFTALRGAFAAEKLNRGQPEAALDISEQGLAEEPADPQLVAIAGEALVRLGRYEDLRALTSRALDANPRHPEFYLKHATSQMILEDANGAEQTLRRGLRIGPRHVMLHARLGELLQVMGRNDEAQHYLQRARQLRDEQAAGAHSSGGH